MTDSEKQMLFVQYDHCFDKNGKIVFDPYREGKNHFLYDILFDHDYLNDQDIYLEYIASRNYPIDSDAVGLYHADILANNTKGNYSTVYYFR